MPRLCVGLCNQRCLDRYIIALEYQLTQLRPHGNADDGSGTNDCQKPGNERRMRRLALGLIWSLKSIDTIADVRKNDMGLDGSSWVWCSWAKVTFRPKGLDCTLDLHG